jgi:hypothetical protein
VDFPSRFPVEAINVAVLPGTAGMDPYRLNAGAAELRSLGMSVRGEAELIRENGSASRESYATKPTFA